MIVLQRALIDSQATVADTQAVRLGEQAARLAVLDSLVREMTTRLEILESQSGMPAWESMEKRLESIEASTKQSPELPPDVVSAGDFPGSIRIPGTDAAIKFGGRIRTALVLTFDPLGTEDRFLTNSIPVGTPSTTGEARRTSISARTSRLNTEFRTPGGVGEVRAFFEGDFAGAGNTFRLRHAYAQYSGLIAGQTWSTFSDPIVNHQDLDFEGLSSENLIRQPQVRYWWRPGPKSRAAVAIETPSVSLTGGVGVNFMPDLVARIIWEGESGGHVQLAGVLRQIRGEAVPGDVRSDIAAGASVSGVFPLRMYDLTDRLMFQVNGGTGIARYINDLSSLGGQDAVFDTTSGDLYALPAIGWYLAYEHAWKQWPAAQGLALRSTVFWSYVGVNTFDFQAPDSYRQTNRIAANLMISTANRVDAGVEYIVGSRENRDGQSAMASQLQFVALIRF
jgi:hypothetical protein